MVYDKKHNLLSLLILNFKITPVCAIAILVYNVLMGVFPVGVTIAFSYFLDSVMTEKGGDKIVTAFISLLSMIAIQKMLPSIFSVVQKKMILDLTRFCDYDVIRRVASLEYNYVESKNEYENICRVVNNTSGCIYDLYQVTTSSVTLVVRIFGILLVFITARVWWIGFGVLLSSFPLILSSYLCGKRIYDFYKSHMEKDLEMNHQAYVLKSKEVSDERILFGFSDILNKKWSKLRESYFSLQIDIHKKAELMMKIPQIISWVVVGIMMIILSGAVFEGFITVSMYIAFANAIIELNAFISYTVSPMSNRVAQIKAFIEDLNAFNNYSYSEDYLDIPSKKDIVDFESLEFRNVSFSYPNTRRKVLSNVSFVINKGNKYAFVGHNGSGKSTIIKLIMGLYSDYEGSILINNKDIGTYSNKYKKALFGIMFQDYAKYQISLKENIDIGAMSYKSNVDEVSSCRKHAIEVANLNILAKKLPKGIYTELGKLDSLGQGVSGGEWQRIALARMVMSDSPVNILDEPTSSIDPMMEKCLYDFILNHDRKKTSITISHRMGVTKSMDRIFVMDNGKIVESGNHEELINKKGIYFDMYYKQQGRYL